jgi:hypothetical protein
MSASGCLAVGAGSAALDFKRAQSVFDRAEVDFRFAAGCFAERDDADFMFALRVND